MESATPNDNLRSADPLPTANKPLPNMEVTVAEKDTTVVNSSTCVSSEQLMPQDGDQQLPKSPLELAGEPSMEEEKCEVPQSLAEADAPPPPAVEEPEVEEREVPKLSVEPDEAVKLVEDASNIDGGAQTVAEESLCETIEKLDEPDEEMSSPHPPAESGKGDDTAVLDAGKAAEEQPCVRETVLEEAKKEPEKEEAPEKIDELTKKEQSSEKVPSFETPEEAVQSLPKLEPEAIDEQSEESETPLEIASRRPNKRNRRESGDSLPSMRPRKESRRPSTRDDDTEPEQHTKTKRRKTLPPRQQESDSITEMSLAAVPDGWKQPLLYFVEGRPYDYSKNKWVHELDEEASQSQSSHKSNDRRNIRWLRLGDLLIKTGAIYLSPTDTGAPGIANHAEGPTAIVRDLCALVQAGASDPVPLHLGAYTALGRANARDNINLKAHKWDSGIGITRVLKAGNEKEAVQLLPLDIIAWCLANNLRAMLAHSELFPGHLFASPMHLLQFGPTIAIHLAIANRTRRLAELIRIFVDSDTEAMLNDVEDSYNKGVGGTRVAGGRRRMTNKAKEHTGLRTYPMSDNDRRQLVRIVDSLESALTKFRKVELEDTTTYPSEFADKEYEQGALVFKDLQVPLLSLSSAAMRTKVYAYYGLKPCMIDLWENALPEKSLQEVLKHLGKEDEKWLMSGSSRVFLDFTLSEPQEQWILQRGRREIDLNVPKPESPVESRLLRHLLTHPTEDVSESAHNCVLEIKLTDSLGKQGDEYIPLISLKTIRKVNSNDKLILDVGHPLVSWEELANDESDSDSTSSQT